MRYLVTGGAGFIGSHLVDALVEKRGEVVVLDNLRRGKIEFISDHVESGRCVFIEGDIRDLEVVRNAVKGVDVVFHLAAQSNVIGAGEDVAYSAETNVMGTINVLSCALSLDISRVIFTSSREVYGDAVELPVTEKAPLAAKNLYGASKVSGEMYCRAFRQMGLDVRWLRLGNVYGQRDRERVIPIWLDRACKGLDLELYGGSQILDLVSVDLVVRALILCAEATDWAGPINIASGQGTPLTELASRVIELTKSSSRAIFLPSRQEEVVGFVADVTAMKERLGISPQAPLAKLSELVLQRLAPRSLDV